MDEDEILNRIERSLEAYHLKNPSTSFRAILDGSGEPILIIGIRGVKNLLRSVFGYELLANRSVDIIDPDAGFYGKTIISLIRGFPESWQIAYFYGSGEDE